MSALEAALDKTADPFPHGLFWFERAGSESRPTVTSLLDRAREKGCQAALLEIGGFDELMADLFLPYHQEFPEVRDIVKAERKGRHPVSLVYVGRQWPVLRTNALEITKYPSTCTVFTADIGGAKEVKTVALSHRDRLTAGRRQRGVVAFGTRADLITAFQGYNPREFEPYPLDPRRFRYEDSVELGLFYDAVCQAIATQTSLRRSTFGKGRSLYLPSTEILNDTERKAFAQLEITPVRQARKDGPLIHEGIHLTLEHRDYRLWLLIEPKLMVTTDGTVPYTAADRADIGREDLVRRYNKKANDLLALWIDFLASRCGSPIVLAFPSIEETEARFEIQKTTAFARRAQ